MADLSWGDLAAKLRGGPAPVRSSSGSVKRELTEDDDLDNVDTSDTARFPPPEKRRSDNDRKRDPVRGWIQKGKDSEGRGGVNVYKKDETLITLAMEGKATLESQLKVCSKPVIGLEHVIEFIDPETESNIRVYHCTLCAVFRTAATILEHVCSYHHKVRVLRKKFPNEANMFLCQDKKTINRNVALMGLASKRAAEHELVYGRGEVQVRYERPSFPENDLDNEENDEIVILSSKQLEYLEVTLKELRTLKIQSSEEMRVVKKIIELLTAEMCDYKVNNPTETMAIE